MKVAIRILHDSHNTDTKASMGVKVERPGDIRKVTFILEDGRELTVELEELNYALIQPY